MASALRNKFWSWRSGRLARNSFPHDEKENLNETDRLISRLYSNGIAHSTIRQALRVLTQALNKNQLHMSLDLAVKAAERKINPASMLELGLVKVAKSLEPSQFYAAVDLASRLIEKQIDPASSLEHALPVVAKNSTSPAEFQANLEMLERLIVARNGQQMWVLDKLPALAPDLFRGAIEVGCCMAENGFDPEKFFESLKLAHTSLSEAQMWAGLDLTTRLAHEKMDLREPLLYGLVETAKAVDRDQVKFDASLEAASRLVQKKIPPYSLLRYGVPAALKTQQSANAFQGNLRALEQFVVNGAQNESHNQRVLGLLSSIPLTSEQLRLTLEFAARFVTSEIDVTNVFEAGLKATLNSTRTPEEIRANFEALERFLPLFDRYQLTQILETIPQANLNSQQFCAGLEAASRLAEKKVQSSPLLKYGLPATVRVSTAPEDFGATLETFETFLVRFAKHAPISDLSFADGFQAALQGQTISELEAGLEAFGMIITQLTEQRVLGNIASDLYELVKQAIALKECYEGFEVVLHEAITREAEYVDSYYGGTSTVTQVDYPQWLELIPTGRRLTPIRLALLDRAHIERLLEKRSWLYRYEERPANRERAIERIAHWRSYLLVFIDQLMRHGILDSVAPIISAYLIGSYPWVTEPNDLDLFLVVEGLRDVSYFSSAELIDKGVALPEFFVTTESSPHRNTKVPILPHGISVEVVGYETLLRASRGDVRHAEVLASRYCLLYGSVLLAGDDLFHSKTPPAELFWKLQRGLLRDLEKADWPELASDDSAIPPKRAWRKREANALSKLITEQFNL
jgi:hypothetical protein